MLLAQVEMMLAGQKNVNVHELLKCHLLSFFWLCKQQRVVACLVSSQHQWKCHWSWSVCLGILQQHSAFNETVIEPGDETTWCTHGDLCSVQSCSSPSISLNWSQKKNECLQSVIVTNCVCFLFQQSDDEDTVRLQLVRRPLTHAHGQRQRPCAALRWSRSHWGAISWVFSISPKRIVQNWTWMQTVCENKLALREHCQHFWECSSCNLCRKQSIWKWHMSLMGFCVVVVGELRCFGSSSFLFLTSPQLAWTPKQTKHHVHPQHFFVLLFFQHIFWIGALSWSWNNESRWQVERVGRSHQFQKWQDAALAHNTSSDHNTCNASTRPQTNFKCEMQPNENWKD